MLQFLTLYDAKQLRLTCKHLGKLALLCEWQDSEYYLCARRSLRFTEQLGGHGQGLAAFPFKMLRSLSLRSSRHVLPPDEILFQPDQAIDPIELVRGLPKLTCLRWDAGIHCANFQPLRELAGTGKIRELRIRPEDTHWQRHVPLEFRFWPDDLISSFTQLQKLVVSDSPISNAAIRGLSNLRHLNVSNCHALTDDAFAALSQLEHLKMQGCTQAGITDQALLSVGQNLKYLDISNCQQLTSAAFRNVGQNLKYLDISNCQQLTSAAFRNFSQIKKYDVFQRMFCIEHSTTVLCFKSIH